MSCAHRFIYTPCCKCARLYESCWMGINTTDVFDPDDIYQPARSSGGADQKDEPASRVGLQEFNVLQFASVLTGDRKFAESGVSPHDKSSGRPNQHFSRFKQTWQSIKSVLKTKEDSQNRIISYYITQAGNESDSNICENIENDNENDDVYEDTDNASTGTSTSHSSSLSSCRVQELKPGDFPNSLTSTPKKAASPFQYEPSIASPPGCCESDEGVTTVVYGAPRIHLSPTSPCVENISDIPMERSFSI